MRNVLKSFLLLSLCVLLNPTGVQAQGLFNTFFSGRGQLNAAVGYNRSDADAAWLGRGEPAESDDDAGYFPEFTSQSYNLYMTYGLKDDFEATLNVSYVETEIGAVRQDLLDAGTFPDIEGDDSDIQDLNLLLKWKALEWTLGKNRLIVVTAGGGGIPLGDYDTNLPFAIGNGELWVEGHVGVRFQTDFGLFAVVNGGTYLYENIPNANTLSGGIGYGKGRFFGEVNIERWANTEGFDIGPDIAGPALAGNPAVLDRFNRTQEEYTQLRANVFGRITPSFGISVNYGTVLRAANLPDSNSFGISFVLTNLDLGWGLGQPNGEGE